MGEGFHLKPGDALFVQDGGEGGVRLVISVAIYSPLCTDKQGIYNYAAMYKVDAGTEVRNTPVCV